MSCISGAALHGRNLGLLLFQQLPSGLEFGEFCPLLFHHRHGGLGNEAIVALLSGEVDAAAQNPTDIVKHVESGALRMLVSMSPVRWFELPDVPTLLDLGYDIQIDSWAGLSAPAGVEASRLKVLEDAVSSAMNDSEVQGQFKNVGMDPAFMPGEEYQTFLRDGKETIAKQLKEIGMIE